MVLKPTAANPTQHDPHGPDDPLKTFGHHCLHVSRDDEMAEQAFGWGCGWPLEGFSAKMLDRAKNDFSSNPQRQIHSSMTHIAQIILLWEYRGSNRCVLYGSLCTTYFMYTLEKVESNHVMFQSVCLD
jgi:hypothetical protein